MGSGRASYRAPNNFRVKRGPIVKSHPGILRIPRRSPQGSAGPVRSHLVFGLDSMLVGMIMLGMWGGHRNHLRVLLQECHDLREALKLRGCPWTIRQIFREYNTVPEQLAGKAIEESRGLASPRW